MQMNGEKTITDACYRCCSASDFAALWLLFGPPFTYDDGTPCTLVPVNLSYERRPVMFEIEATETLHLLRGQTYFGHLKQRTVIQSDAGAIVVTRHLWVDSTLLVLSTSVASGQSFRLPASGWCSIAAQSEVTLQLIQPHSSVKRFRYWLTKLITPDHRQNSRLLGNS